MLASVHFAYFYLIYSTKLIQISELNKFTVQHPPYFDNYYYLWCHLSTLDTSIEFEIAVK